MSLRKPVDSYSVPLVIHFSSYVNNLQLHKYRITVEGEHHGYMLCFDYTKMQFFNLVQHCILQYFGSQYIACPYIHTVYVIIDSAGISSVFQLSVFILLRQFCMKMCKSFVSINLNLRMCVNAKNDLKYDPLN